MELVVTTIRRLLREDSGSRRGSRSIICSAGSRREMSLLLMTMEFVDSEYRS